jgi:hypothetical protein
MGMSGQDDLCTSSQRLRRLMRVNEPHKLVDIIRSKLKGM